ncbi:tRNA pseudouridine(38-40) synthase TruA [Actinotignum urinale]|uniref:tRNA pseudouridine(38-40) synthase TruA n=1 Tax=Actinotignum urinale TaxID=190146 RepID=UPI00370D6EAF
MTQTVAHNTRLRLDLSYDGTNFHGWAAQPGLRTVEGTLGEALAVVLQRAVPITVAGRTDAGVHARGQVAHIDVASEELVRVAGRFTGAPTEALRSRVNKLLSREAGGPVRSSDVVIHEVSVVDADFDARFSALSREYTYRIATRDFDPLRRHDVLWLDAELNVPLMNAAAQLLVGEHDFLSFCKPREGATTIRELLDLRVVEESTTGLTCIHAKADAFCHSMVRTLVGSLLRVGTGKRSWQWPAVRLEERNRTGEVVIAPPHPLTLEKVNYPAESEWGARAAQARHMRGEG